MAAEKPTGFEYVYEPLPPGASVRYMILKPGQGSEPLQCTLHTTSLDKMPEFEAISYVWGSSNRDHVIICGERCIYITRNLRDALRQLRLVSEPRTLWADSICIHQADRKEQGHQVALMGDIYGRTKRTLICLGADDSEHAQHVASLVLEINATVDQLPRKGRYNKAKLPHIDPLKSDPRWNSIGILIQHDWFHRLWVVQEAALAPEGVMHWGAHKIDWVSFISTVLWAAALAPTIIDQWSTWFPDLHLLRLGTRCDLLPKVFRRFMGDFKMGLMDMMRNGRALGAADDRDRIYAIMGLANQLYRGQRPFEITPDYERPAIDIFSDFAEDYLRVTKDMDILNCVQHNSQSLTAQSPSWVPQWNASAGLVWSIRSRTQLTSQNGSVYEPVILGNGKLKLRGVLLDRLQFNSSPFSGDAATVATLAAQVWNELRQSNIKSAYPTRYDHLAFTWTLCAGKRPDRLPERLHKDSEARYLFDMCQQGAQFNPGLLAEIETWGKQDVSNAFGIMVAAVARGRCLTVTDRGYFGLGPSIAQPGDLCCIVFGAKSPYILRETQIGGQYKFVGDMYMTTQTQDQESYGSGNRFTYLGKEQSKDWVSWGLDEQDIVLC